MVLINYLYSNKQERKGCFNHSDYSEDNVRARQQDLGEMLRENVCFMGTSYLGH